MIRRCERKARHVARVVLAALMTAHDVLIIGATLLSGATMTAWMFEGLFAIATTSVVVARVCAPANLYLRFTRTAEPAPSLRRSA